DAPLLRHRLLMQPQRSAGLDIPVPIQQPVVCASVIDFVFGQDRVDERLSGCAELVAPRRLESFGAYDRHHWSIRDRLLSSLKTGGVRSLAYIGGPVGSQRARLVEQIARDMGCRVLRVRAKRLFTSTESVDDALALLGRDARLHSALLHLEDIDDLLSE